MIGVDCDNTIVCYDTVFYNAAVEKGLVPGNTGKDKSSVRNYLRAAGREDEWTKLQGYIYGPGMSGALPFPGAADFFRTAASMDIPVTIISHRTQKPYLGPEYDLHESARQWLRRNDFPARSSFFETTKEKKLERIADRRCTHFIDDLPEFLAEPDFPAGVVKILFDPNGRYEDSGEYVRVESWSEITDMLLRPEAR